MPDLQPDDSLIASIRKACTGSGDDVRQALALKTNSIGIQAGVEIAQAAERTFQFAEKAKSYAESHPAKVRNKIVVETSELSDYSSTYFTEFRIDPSLDILTRVRATERISVVLCIYEAESINAAIRTPRNPANMRSLGVGSADVLCHAGAFFYGLAASHLEAQSQIQSAKLLNLVFNNLLEKAPDIKRGTPSDIIRKIAINYRNRHDVCTRLRNETAGSARPSIDLLVNLACAFDTGPYRPGPGSFSAARHRLRC